MWPNHSPFLGHAYHYPVCGPPGRFFFPDRPLTAEEFARHQEVARQQDLLRRRSSGITDEHRSRTSERRSQSTDGKGAAALGMSPLARDFSENFSDPEELAEARNDPESDERSAEQQSVSACDSQPDEPMHQQEKSPSHAAGSRELVLAEAQPLSRSSSDQLADSSGLEDLSVDLASSKDCGGARSPPSSLSDLPSWGSINSSAKYVEAALDAHEHEISSQPYQSDWTLDHQPQPSNADKASAQPRPSMHANGNDLQQGEAVAIPHLSEHPELLGRESLQPGAVSASPGASPHMQPEDTFSIHHADGKKALSLSCLASDVQQLTVAEPARTEANAPAPGLCQHNHEEVMAEQPHPAALHVEQCSVQKDLSIQRTSGITVNPTSGACLLSMLLHDA